MDTTLIWHRFHDEIYHFILRQVKDSDIAGDILQEVFIKIHLKLDTLSEQDKLAQWIYRITRNAINDHFRKVKHTHPATYILEEEESHPHDFEKCLSPFVDQLAPIYRDALKQTELGNMSQKAYAEQIGSTYSTVKSRVQRAKKQLMELFMACCEPVFDRYGNVVDRKKEQCSCGCVA